MISALPMLVLLLCLLSGVPIAVALAGSGMFGIWLITGDLTKVLNIVGLVPFSSVADYQLTTIPMFILMAYFSASSGLARDLYAAAAAWLSHLRGGLAIATVFACGIFGAMSGASTAAASVMRGSRCRRCAATAIPRNSRPARSCRRHARHSHSAEHCDGDLRHRDADLDPQAADRRCRAGHHRPCSALIDDLPLGPGSPSHAPATFRTPPAERRASLLRVWPSLLLIVLVLILLYSGIATPTEVGALGALLAAVIGAVLAA